MSDSTPNRPRAGRSRLALETALALAFVAAVAYGATHLPDGSAIRPLPEEARALPVEAVEVERVESYVRERRFAGEVRARRETALGFERIARVVELPVAEGDAVERGELLAALDVAGLQARRAALTASLAAARALLAEQVAGPRAERIAAARARLEELGARLALARTVSERRAALQAREAVSLEELQAAEREVDALAAGADAARAELAELEAGTRPERIEAQRAEIDRLTAEVDAVDVQLANSRLTAPFDGLVRSVSFDLGTTPVPGSSLIELVEADAPEVWIGLPPERVADAAALEDVAFTLGGRELAARFRAALPDVDAATRTRTAVFELLDVELGEVVPGQVAELRLPETVDADGLWLAADGLVRSRRGLWAAFVLEPLADEDDEAPVDATHRLVRRELETLATDGRRVLARGDLADGELVLASGAQRVSAGQAVRLIGLADGVARRAARPGEGTR